MKMAPLAGWQNALPQNRRKAGQTLPAHTAESLMVRNKAEAAMRRHIQERTRTAAGRLSAGDQRMSWS